MSLTRSFKATVCARAERDPEFRSALLREAVQSLIEGDADNGRSVLRDYINATIGFEELADIVHTPPKRLMRMFGPNGNPRADNLLGVIHALQQHTGVHLEVHAVSEPA